MLGRSLSTRITKLKENHDTEADIDTHFAFVMSFKKNLILLQDTKKKLVQYQFSSVGPDKQLTNSTKCFAAAMFGNGYKVLFE